MIFKKFASNACFTIIALTIAFACQTAQAELKAGAAKADITPDVVSQQIPLGGYAARKAAPATGVHDPVYARAIVLSEGVTKVAIVSLDLCFLPANVKTEVAKRLAANDEPGIDAAHLFLSATHTHSAPDPLAMHSGNTFTKLKGWSPFDGKLLAFTADRIAQAIREADKALVPAQIGVKSVDATGLNRNRRGDTTVDPALTVVKIAHMNGTPIASIVNFAAHPTLYDDKMMRISADWPGVMTADIERNSDKEIENQKLNKSVCLFLNGAEGDASPNGVDNVVETVNAAENGKANDGANGEAKVTAYGHRMSQLAIEQLLKITLDGSQTLGMWTQSVALPPRKPNGLFLVAASQLGATMTQARELVDALMPITTQLTFVHIGDLLLMGFPCEPSGSIGLEAKQMARDAGYKTPAVVALTNDWLGYGLTPAQYKAGKYEAVMSFYGEPFGTVLLDNLKIGLASKKPVPTKL